MDTRGSSPQMRQIDLSNPITPKPSRIPHQTFTPKPIYKETLNRQPPAGSKPLRNSIQLVMTGPPQPPSLHPPQKFMTTLPQQLSAPHYNHKVFRMTNKNMMHPFFSNPYGYHKQTIQNRVVDRSRVQDLYNRRKNKNPIQPLKNFKEQFQRNSKVQPSNNSAYGQFYSGEYKYGFFVNPQQQQNHNLEDNGLNMQTITLDTMYPAGYFEKNQPNIQGTYMTSPTKSLSPTYEELIRAKARTYLNSRRSSHSPMGFQETNKQSFEATARNTIGSRGFWRAKREHDNHSHLTTHFRHPKHIKYNSIGSEFQTMSHSNYKRSYYPQGGVNKDEIDSVGYRTNGWESPVGKRRGYSNMTKFKRDLELNKIQNSWRMSTYRNDVKGF